MVNPIIIGGCIGFGLFLVSLETCGMENIIWRNGKFTPKNIIHYMKSPFKEKFLWSSNLWASNWIITTGVGALAGCISVLFHKN
jgi:hypothetical protein